MIEFVVPVAVASPCVGICVMSDEHDLCEGCGRTLDEIAGWIAMGPDLREAVSAALASRLAGLRGWGVAASQ